MQIESSCVVKNKPKHKYPDFVQTFVLNGTKLLAVKQLAIYYMMLFVVFLGMINFCPATVLALLRKHVATQNLKAVST